MKNSLSLRGAATLALCLFAITLAGCSSNKSTAGPKKDDIVHHERGWIGGEFKLAGEIHHFLWVPLRPKLPMPRGAAYTNRTGLLIIALGTNTPSHQAGLAAGDLIVAVNQQPVTTIGAFRQLVDAAKPGSSLPVTAWRSGQTLDCNISVGRELYHNVGQFGLWVPFYNFSNLGKLDLWPNPDFAVGPVIGFDSNYRRVELNTPEGDYRRAVSDKPYTRDDVDWNAWLVVLSARRFKTIESQEIFSATNSASVSSNSPAAK